MEIKKDWLKARLQENELNKQKVYGLFERFKKETGSDYWTEDTYKRYVRSAYNDMVENGEIDLSEQVVSLDAGKQRALDLNNYLRKSNRENYRLYNSLQEVYTEYVELLQKVDLSKIDIKPYKVSGKAKIGIFQLSDLHANELITPSESFDNTYNFDILSKRLKKFVTEAIIEFKANNVNTVYVLMTGDMLNSSRRLSEKLAMNSSLTCASLLLTYLLEQAIIELSKSFSIHVSFCSGNESRIEQDNMDSNNILASSNYDFLVFHNLRNIFRDKPIDFIVPKNNIQSIVHMNNGFNVLITHGHTFKGIPTNKIIPTILQQYAYSNTRVNAILIGHFHHCEIGDVLSASGCMCGGNSYTSNDLMYLTRASQNIYIVNDDMSYKGIKIDLQDTANYKGYALKEELEAYAPIVNGYNNTVTIQNLV